jgi:hypothetical protein
MCELMDFVPTDQDPVAIGEVFLRLGGDHTAHERPVGDDADCLIVVLPGALGENSLEDITGRVVSNEFGRYALITVAGLRLPVTISNRGAAL